MKEKGKWTPHIIAITAFVLFIALGLACATYPSGARNSSAADKEKQLKRAAAWRPRDAKAQYEWGHYLRFTKREYVQSIQLFEKTLSIDPNYRVSININWRTSEGAAINGIVTTGEFYINKYPNDFSLLLLLGEAYLYGSISENSTGIFAEEEKQNALEKALDALRRGYEIDITGGKGSSENLKVVYLAFMARTLDYLNRRDEATEVYAELAKITRVTPEIASRIGNTPTQTSPQDIIDFTREQSNYLVFEIGKTYRLNSGVVYEGVIMLPRNYQSVTITTGGNIDTIFEQSGMTTMWQLLNSAGNAAASGMREQVPFGTYTDDISSSNRNARLVYGNVKMEQNISFQVSSKTEGFTGTYTLTIEAVR